MLFGILVAAAITGVTAADAPSGDELVVAPGETIAATVDGMPAQLHVESGGIDRLTLDIDFVTANGIRPALLAGRASLSVAGRKEFEGHNRPMTMAVAGRMLKARTFWFADAPDSGADGRIGPWGLPQSRVTFALRAARPGEQVLRLSLHGEASNGSYAGVRLDGRNVGLSFAVEDDAPMPVATAALGALIAEAYGGTLEGASWDVEVLMGVRRPVRLLRLATPMEIGPLRFDRLAVRVRDRIDAGGRGTAFPETGEVADPAEVVVTGKSGGAAPSYGLTISRAGLAGCSRLTYDKAAKVIELACGAGGS